MGVLGTTEGRTWKGRDAEGRPIFKSRGIRSPTTCNRYLTSLGSVYKWARRRRLTQRGFVSPTRGIERHADESHRVRYLTDDERTRLLKVCRVSSWPKLYLMVVLALTTGARKGELLALTWGDIDFRPARRSLRCRQSSPCWTRWPRASTRIWDST
jgi:integrase